MACGCGCGETGCVHGVLFSDPCAECQKVEEETQFDKLWVRRVIKGHPGEQRASGRG